MARRCGYCGKFCHPSRFHEGSGLCVDCKVELGETSENEGEGAGVEMVDSGQHPLSMDCPDKHEAIMHDTNAAETVEDDSSESPNKISQGNYGEDTGKSGSGKKNSEGKAEQLCGRCWIQAATSILYGCPTCNDCVDIAEKERANKTGNQRFQPRTPNLPPGKRLTRVCDACRAKRKRCPHRQIVDANDPGVARRNKKAAMTEAAAEEVGGSENDDDMSSDMEVDPPVAEEGGKAPAPLEVPDDQGSSADENLQLAIRDAVRVVYDKELRRMLERVEERASEASAAMTAASAAVAAVQTHVESWHAQYEGYGLRGDEDGAAAAAQEALDTAEEAVETAKENISAWLEKTPVHE